MSITKMDANGRVLLPIGIRYKLDLNSGDRFAIDHLGDGTIILKKIDLQMPIDEIVENANCICPDISENDLPKMQQLCINVLASSEVK